MLKEQWLEQVNLHREKLCEFIGNYHPSNLLAHKDNDLIDYSITAPSAEQACEVVRNMIREETMFVCPDVQFNVALQNKDATTISSLLGSAWFGVPESTSCWQITGFKEAVDLLDDPIEEEFEG